MIIIMKPRIRGNKALLFYKACIRDHRRCKIKEDNEFFTQLCI